MADTRTCYIISPIGKPESEERKWANFVRKNILKPSLKACGYTEPERSDDPETELLMTDIIAQMFNADLVVADLTGFNPNVFYELGLRHCAKKPVIHLIKDGQMPPFDLAGNKVIFISRDFERVHESISEIKDRIEAIEKNPEQFYSQVQVYMQLNELDVLKKSHSGLEQDMIEGLKMLLRLGQSNANALKELHDEGVFLKPTNIFAGSAIADWAGGNASYNLVAGVPVGGDTLRLSGLGTSIDISPEVAFNQTKGEGEKEQKEEKESDT